MLDGTSLRLYDAVNNMRFYQDFALLQARDESSNTRFRMPIDQYASLNFYPDDGSVTYNTLNWNSGAFTGTNYRFGTLYGIRSTDQVNEMVMHAIGGASAYSYTRAGIYASGVSGVPSGSDRARVVAEGQANVGFRTYVEAGGFYEMLLDSGNSSTYLRKSKSYNASASWAPGGTYTTGLWVTFTFSGMPAGYFEFTLYGSGYRPSGSGSSSVDINLDGVAIGSTYMYFNNAGVHHALSGCTFGRTLAAGTHTIELFGNGSLYCDGGDPFRMHVVGLG
jgi:hypothetical protein